MTWQLLPYPRPSWACYWGRKHRWYGRSKERAWLVSCRGVPKEQTSDPYDKRIFAANFICVRCHAEANMLDYSWRRNLVESEREKLQDQARLAEFAEAEQVYQRHSRGQLTPRGALAIPATSTVDGAGALSLTEGKTDE
jgi:hypothetical protein